MQIAPEQGQFMALLVKLIGARRTIEIGVFTGYSALTVALALPDDGHLLACDISDEYTRVGRPFWAAGRRRAQDRPAARRRRWRRSMPRSPPAEPGSYDFAFIDADKTGYDAYYERCLQLLRAGRPDRDRQRAVGRQRSRGRPSDADTAALQALNDKLHGDERIDLVDAADRRRPDAGAQALAPRSRSRRRRRPAGCAGARPPGTVASTTPTSASANAAACAAVNCSP